MPSKHRVYGRAAEPTLVAMITAGRLFVDSDGRILRRFTYTRGGRELRLEPPSYADAALTPSYRQVHASINSTIFIAAAHRVIWIAANGPIAEKLDVNHRNGDKADNRLSNLEVVTHRENCRHAVRHGLKRVSPDCRNGHPKTKANWNAKLRRCHVCEREKYYAQKGIN